MSDVAAVMVLAAGRGERMRPLSDVLPKPAPPLIEGPVVTSALRLAARTQPARIVVNTWHLADLMARAVATATPAGTNVAVSPEGSLMGTAGGLALARDRGLLGSEGPVLVINGDGIADLDILPLIEFHAVRRDAVTLGLLPHPDTTRWSRVLVDDNGAVSSIRRPGAAAPGEASLVYPGAMIVSREALKGLPSSPGEIPDRLWFPALEIGALGGATITGWWREVGTAEDYLAVIMDQLAGTSRIHPEARVAPSAVIDRVTIGDRAVVRGSVVVDGAAVGADCRLTSSVLLGPVETAIGEHCDNEFRVAPVEPR